MRGGTDGAARSRYLAPLFATAALAATTCIAAGLTAPGCARIGESRVEQALDEALPRYLGPADRYTSHVESGSLGSILRGRLDRVHVEGDGVHLRNGLTLTQLTLDFTSVSIDPKERTLQSLGSAQFSVRLSEQALNDYAATHPMKDLSDVHLTLEPDRVRADVKVTTDALSRFGITGVRVPVRVEGGLTVEPGSNGERIDLVPDAARVSILSVPRSVIEYAARQLNPAVDLSALPLPVDVGAIQVAPDGVTLSGSVPPDAIVRAADDGDFGGR